MATADTIPLSQEGHSRSHHFRRFMKRLTKMKSSDSSSSNGRTKKSNAQKGGQLRDGQDPDIGHAGNGLPQPSSLAATDSQNVSNIGETQSQTSLAHSTDDNHGTRTAGARSIAPTIATQPGTTHSDATRSKSGTFTTAGGGAMSTHEPGGEGSTFSSPAPSVRSLTTTLTTIQSTAPGHLLNNPTAPQSSTSTHFSHQFPTTPTPASAIPPHVTGQQLHGTHSHTYNTATANNLLSDDASVLTLASSTKRRRRNSLDTNASVKALAPGSVFGGSRESLPLSVLSANVSNQERESRDQPSQMSLVRPSIGTAAAERASIYSNSAAAEGRETRSSYHATRVTGDGASVRSGFLGHGRSESITGSIGGPVSPLASPMPVTE